MLPLLLGLGILAGNQYMKDRRDDQMAEQYRGLLGTAPAPMGPPTEGGEMGYSGGSGLLADPTNIQNQLQFAAGVAGLRNQQGAGLNLLNAAFSRAQQEAESRAGREQAQSNWERQFGFTQDQATQAQRNWELNYGAGRQDAADAAARWGKQFDFQQGEAARNARQWGLDFGLRQDAAARDQTRLGLEQGKAAGPELPKLSPGWHYVATPGGGAIAAPIPGTEDWAKGTQTAETLLSADDRIGNMLDMLQGKEKLSRDGKRIVREGGVGSELFGQKAAQYSTLRGQIIADVAFLQNKGVLQGGELEQIDKWLPDPTTFGAMLTPGSNSTSGAAYQKLRDMVKRRRDEHYKANPWLVPPVPKGFELTK